MDELTPTTLNEATLGTLGEAAPINLEEEEPATVTTDDRCCHWSAPKFKTLVNN